MTTALYIVTGLFVWIVVSIPLGVIVGRQFARNSKYYPEV